MKFCNLRIRREMSAVEKSALGEFRLYWLWAPDSPDGTVKGYALKLRLNICESDCPTFFAD